jgi:hypothetical protein
MKNIGEKQVEREERNPEIREEEEKSWEKNLKVEKEDERMMKDKRLRRGKENIIRK